MIPEENDTAGTATPQATDNAAPEGTVQTVGVVTPVTAPEAEPEKTEAAPTPTPTPEPKKVWNRDIQQWVVE